jgi:hypothetical protein
MGAAIPILNTFPLYEKWERIGHKTGGQVLLIRL